VLTSFLKHFCFFTSPFPSALLVYGHIAQSLQVGILFGLMRQSHETTRRSSANPVLLKSRDYHPLPKTSSLGKHSSSSFLDVFFLLGTPVLTFCLTLSTCFPRSFPIAGRDHIDSVDEQSKRDSAIQPDCVSCHVCFVKKTTGILTVDQRRTSKDSGYVCSVACMWSSDVLRFSCTPKKFRRQCIIPGLPFHQ
jgi:hypothetical protein